MVTGHLALDLFAAGMSCTAFRCPTFLSDIFQEVNMNIPNDPAILLSYVNTKLRDDFPSLDEMCKSLCIPQEQIESKLAAIGYVYDQSKNRFI